MFLFTVFDSHYDAQIQIQNRGGPGWLQLVNYHHLFRSLYIAIHFYGERMEPKTFVWHGVSRRMHFESFATYFECPTSTSTSKEVARTFSGPDGMILKLKSKFKESCSVMLNVSVFSDYPEECERLFVKETLIITDVMMKVDDKWTSFGLYFKALVYFEVCHTSNVFISSQF